MKLFYGAATTLLLVMIMWSNVLAATPTKVPSIKVDTPPVLDGNANEEVWKAVDYLPVTDTISGRKILIKSVYSGDKVYFSVHFPDPVHNFLHKPLIWNSDSESYETGAHREDTFVFKWNMMDKSVDLSNFSTDTYLADVWYWKANRTNPVGHADDKHHILGDAHKKKSTEVIATTGETRFLSRKSDSGKSAYSTYEPSKFEGNTVNHYPQRIPEGSRADVKAKGVWKAGMWHIEFERKFDTGNNKEDVIFDLAKSKEYLFGISIFSLYGRPHDPKSPNFYGRGRISQPLMLSFE